MEFNNTVVVIVVTALILSVGSVVVFGLNDGDVRPEKVKGLAVYVNAVGTDATYARGAIYSETGHLIATTSQTELVGDSWNILTFDTPVNINTVKMKYILAVQGDGVVSIPASGTDCISSVATYGTFPGSISDTNHYDKLSIYAIYR